MHSSFRASWLKSTFMIHCVDSKVFVSLLFIIAGKLHDDIDNSAKAGCVSAADVMKYDIQRHH